MIKLTQLLVLLVVVTSPLAYAKISRPNILFILSDNQSYYEMACHGNSYLKTPHLDRLASQSVDFQNFYASSYCSPSRSIILSGKYAIRTGVYNTIGGRSIMQKGHKTLADIFSDNGYKTAISGKWHLGYSYPFRPQDRGFEETYVLNGGCLGQIEDYYENDHIDPVLIHNGKQIETKGFSTDVLFDHAMNWIEGLNGKPFFYFLSTPAVHGPYQSPDGKRGHDALNPMIENVDMNVGRMLDKLDELGLTDNTIVIFASDQGMFDRGAPHLTDRKENSIDAKQHIPFIVRVPGVQPRIDTNITGILDFAPTVLDLCGIEIPSDFDGVSLKPLLNGKLSDFPVGRTLVVQCPRGRSFKKERAVVRTKRWRLDGRKLFDKKNDPRLRTDVAKQNPEVVQRLKAVRDTFDNSLPPAEETLSRCEIGAPEHPNNSLTAMDWITGDHPWSQGDINKARAQNLNGSWAVQVVQDGTYTFELRQYPVEADKVLDVTRAKIKIGEMVKEQSVLKLDKSTSFSLELKKGDYYLQTWLTDGAKVNFGALYIDVKKVK